MNQKTYRFLWIVTLIVLLAVYFKNAWVSDDGFIIFRSIEQLFDGNGPRWNPHERVQTFTSPLWFMVLSLVRIVSSDLYLNSIVLSCVLLVATFVVVARMKCNAWFTSLVPLLWLSSNAFFDYTSSGLENVLAYLLIALYLFFFLKLIKNSADEALLVKGHIRKILFLAGLLIFVRHDLLLLIFPPSAYLIFRWFKSLSLKEWISLGIVSVLPLGLFTLFSIIYFGFPLPNTALHKIASHFEHVE